LSILVYSDHKVWSSPRSASFRQFLDFIKWLNGEKGKKAKAYEALKISKMNLEKKEITKNDLALAQMLVDYAASRQKARSCIENEIEELKNRQKELEMESANIEADLKTKLGPIYEFKAPSIHELRIEAYKLYVADCLSKKITPLPRHHEMAFEKAMEGFGATVKELNHLVKYLNDPVRKEIIRDFFKQKILRIEYAGHNKSQSGEDYDSFHNFAVALRGEEASNESRNVVHKFACDVTGGDSDEQQPPDSKRARIDRQPKEQEMHVEVAKKV
ncbi:uncharacterized protein LOC131610994, partial [Vicia villosa]|uniref:uncharacterized protein LOC131610994 n=1 Tax=Vicia villosa TaxID=3911 RepID=UPI00273C2CCF